MRVSRDLSANSDSGRVFEPSPANNSGPIIFRPYYDMVYFIIEYGILFWLETSVISFVFGRCNRKDEISVGFFGHVLT